eukprot:CAMPEP_0198148428 /NCGR_PEP_ID=MMETSP1443-20131203/41397_1 /TAXON_ID=186043 /ORGANISM="Entomoneis sp., Strain CCMP2396" /LENGTH=403 /DNA_ID=CAMNT_0043813113 /DNA_START=79 /DNA_END=1290 /DNA_ORIENTATION=-
MKREENSLISDGNQNARIREAGFDEDSYSSSESTMKVPKETIKLEQRSPSQVSPIEVALESPNSVERGKSGKKVRSSEDISFSSKTFSYETPNRTNSTKLLRLKKDTKKQRGRPRPRSDSEKQTRSNSCKGIKKDLSSSKDKIKKSPNKTKNCGTTSSSDTGGVAGELKAFLKQRKDTKGTHQRALRRNSTGSRIALTEAEVQQVAVKAADRRPGILRKDQPPSAHKKKVWHASDDTVTYYDNEEVDEEEVKALWFDPYDLRYFREANDQMLEKLVSDGSAAVWQLVIQRAFDACGGADDEEDLKTTRTVCYKMKNIYRQEPEMVGLEHIFLESIKYDGNRRRGKVLDLVEKIQNERYFRRRASGKGPDHSDERARLSYECTEKSRTSRFFSHGMAMARLSAA